MRLWIPAIIIEVAAANIIRLQTMPELDALPKRFWSLLSVLAAVPLLLIWWLFRSRLRWRVRLVGAVVAVLCAVGLGRLVRVDGSLGTGQPIIVWSWTPRKTGDVPGNTAVSAARAGAALEGEMDYPGYLGATCLGAVVGIRRVPFGGHGAGPVYLIVRIPLQMFLTGWVWWFAVRRIP